jgi:hypothetical protein
MAKETLKTNFLFSILRIKDLQFNVYEHLFVPNKGVQINLLQTLGFNIETETVNLTLGVMLHYIDSSPNEILIEINVQNLFKVENLKNYITENNQLKLPQEAIITLTSLSISHSRALLAKNTAGTAFQDTLLPIMNPVEVATSLNPIMFEKSSFLNNNISPIQVTKKKAIKKK